MIRRSTCIVQLFLAASCTAPEPVRHVGELPGGGHVVATEQVVRPAGNVRVIDGRALDFVLSPDGRHVFVKLDDGVLALDTASLEITKRIELKEGGSMHGIAVSRDGTKLYVTGARSSLFEIAAGDLALLRTIVLPGNSPYPCGIALTPDGSRALVCLSRENVLGVVELASGKLEARIEVGVAPYDVVLAPEGNTAYVSNLGGRRLAANEPGDTSSGTPIAVDARGIDASGTLSRVDLAARAENASIECGLHPSDLELSSDGARIFVAAANSDAVYAVDSARFAIAERIDVRPDPTLPFGSLVNALALAPDGRTLYAANGGNNAIAVVNLGAPGEKSTLAGFVPTGWFPGALAVRGNELLVATLKGTGARVPDAKLGAYKSTHDRGSLAKVALGGARQLTAWTAQVRADSRVPQALRAQVRRMRPGVFAPIEHVVYVIKENRTYDQVLGDLPQGNGAPALCTFGREVTPNHHALAEQFVLLDNYYCNGVVSADGHQWATQGIALDYVEKQFGGATRSYDLGTDALAYASSGFLWDAVLLAGLSFRNYGEFDLAQIESPSGGWPDVQRAARAGELRWHATITPGPLKERSAPAYPGWELRISDQYRVERFLEDLARMEAAHEFPSLAIVYLPQDHTSGAKAGEPTPRACVADNDLALGRLVEALSRSSFWRSMVVFVNEDDPQDGWDHVDGHRSLCLVAGPYVKRGARVRHFYNQTSVLCTIERILGLPPLTQRDAAADAMTECFTSEPDFAPWSALPNRIALDELNPPKSQARAEHDLSQPDRIDDDEFNREIWATVRGDEPYPAEFAGAHGTGLRALGLELDGDDD